MKLPSLLAAIAVVAACVATPAAATDDRFDATDLWINPNESGWGLNVIHQGGTLFATLFVYGPDGAPKWYVASSLTARGFQTTYTGSLFECSGPWFGGPFDSSKVTCRQSGTMSLDVGSSSGVLDYTVDGVHVTKNVTRFSFKKTSLAGSYVGFMVTAGPMEVDKELTRMDVTDDGSTVRMSTQGTDGDCTWTGSHVQEGQYESVIGTFACGASSGGWRMTVDPTSEGFTGLFALGAGNAIGDFSPHIAAAQRGRTLTRGNGWPSDMWFPPSESGWGLNVIEQGTTTDFTIFATLFVYDPQGRPRWYVASDVARSDLAGDQTTYLGTLFETTGPYFGAATFDPAAVKRRPVGTITITTTATGGARVAYTVDGVQVVKDIDRFAFDKNGLSGTYWGHLVADASDPDPSHVEMMRIRIDDLGFGPAFQMHTTAASGTCDYTAPFQQHGGLRIVNGTYTCSNGRSGAFSMTNATVSWGAFAPHFSGNGISSGHMEGARIELRGDAP
jgi:hypothetical protein